MVYYGMEYFTEGGTHMMPLICPGCGGRLEVEEDRPLQPFTCPYCAQALVPEKNGRAVILKPGVQPAVPCTPQTAAPKEGDPAALLLRAEGEKDPGKKYMLLLEAEKAAPQDLKVQMALLLHGRLHERDGRRVDFSVIKSYILHIFEEPKSHSDKEREAMLRELFHEERLTRCLGFAPDPDGFLRDYLERLSLHYITLFLRGNSRYMKPIFGFSTGLGKAPRLLAEPVARMLFAMLLEPLLSYEERSRLARAFYAAFHRDMAGDTQALDSLLGDDLGRCKPQEL